MDCSRGFMTGRRAQPQKTQENISDIKYMNSKFTSEGMFSRIVKGIGASMVGWILNFISKIALVPLFLKTWGVEIYGEWILVSSVVAYLSLTDLGGRLYILNQLTQAYSRADHTKYQEILSSGLALFIVFPMCVYLIFTGFVSLCAINTIFNIHASELVTIKVVLAILAFQIVVSFPYGILVGIYRTVGMLPKGEMLGNLAQLLLIVLTAAGLWMGGKMILISVLQLLPFLLVTLYAYPEIRSLIPEIKPLAFKHARLSSIKGFIVPSLHFFFISASQAITIQGFLILVGILFGPTQVVLFSTLRVIVFFVKQVLDMLSNSAYPEITRLDAQKAHKQLCFLFTGVLRTTLTCAVIIISLLHHFGADLYHLWLQNTVAFDQTLFDLLLLFIFQFVCWAAAMNVLKATSNHHSLAKLVLASAFLSLLVSYLSGYYYGLNGVVIGMITVDLLLPFWLVPFFLYKYNNSFNAYFFISEIGTGFLSLAILTCFPKLTIIIFIYLAWWWWAGIGKTILNSRSFTKSL
jgi:O-antigen/teichoic acid export membrane protein